VYPRAARTAMRFGLSHLFLMRMSARIVLPGNLPLECPAMSAYKSESGTPRSFMLKNDNFLPHT